MRPTSGVGRSRTLACALTAVAVAGCNFGIAGFRAEPNVICGGSQTMLSWVATTDGTLSAVPADASLGPVAATGTRTVSPADRALAGGCPSRGCRHPERRSGIAQTPRRPSAVAQTHFSHILEEGIEALRVAHIDVDDYAGRRHFEAMT